MTDKIPCPRCDGEGLRWVDDTVPCPQCKGDCEVDAESDRHNPACPHCNDEGYVHDHEGKCLGPCDCNPLDVGGAA